MAIKPGSQNARILHALRDGQWHNVSDIQRRAGTTRLNSRVSELRKTHGYKIEHRSLPGKKRAALSHQYRLVNPPQDLPASDGKKRTILKRDAIERTPENRYRIYRLYRGEQELVAVCPTPEQIGRTLIKYGLRGEFNESCIGILDTYGIDKESLPGTWIINPWDTEPTS